MAATTYAMFTQNGGTSVSNAWPNVGGPAQNLDLLQIVGAGGSILANVDYLGSVHVPKSAATTGNTRVGQFETNLTSSATTAQLFASAFTNPQQQDIIQVIAEGGNIVYYLDYLGVSHGS
jgi:hypothetical protein